MGMKMTPEMARSMQSKMAGLSDDQMQAMLVWSQRLQTVWVFIKVCRKMDVDMMQQIVHVALERLHVFLWQRHASWRISRADHIVVGTSVWMVLRHFI